MSNLEEKLDNNEAVVCVVGLGYVGLPLALEFSKNLKVSGFDIDKKKVQKLKNENKSVLFTSNPREISKADFVIICVPTPITKSKDPDLSYVQSAAEIVGQNLKKEAVVVLESTVYPGVTQEIVTPILERTSRMKCGIDFKVGYSPERINPDDEAHSLPKITKIVAGMDKETTEILAKLYGLITNVFKAKDVKTAEAAKVIENIQRDLNIALMNELSLIFEKMGLNTRDILEAAETKWNFHKYKPGLVGGHCIPVDPYYLTHKAEEVGYHSKIILAGRGINDYMPKHIAEMTIKALNKIGKAIKNSCVLIMGLAYKENVPDIRETQAKEIIKNLKEYEVKIFGYDPLLDNIEDEFDIKVVQNLGEVSDADCVILTVAHDIFQEITLDKLKRIMNPNPILIDIRGFFNRKKAEEKGFYYRTL